MLTPAAALEVWGDPVEHSRSPQLHEAAYAQLGLAWTYGRRRVGTAAFGREFLAARTRLRGLSLTMPLKAEAFAAAATRDRYAALTGAVNTLLLTVDGPAGFNTDVGGIAADLADQGFDGIDRARIVGAGATATSALLGLARLGAREVDVVVRRPRAAAAIAELGRTVGVIVREVRFDDTSSDPVPLTVATLPGGAELDPQVAQRLAASGGTLYDVVYGHWPTVLARAWEHTDRPAVGGIGMLVRQALLQVRVFVTGSPDDALDDEAAVLAAMRAAVTGV